ncbi:MAG: hypothetical protein PHF24_04175, partial [Syntrophomonas sp.]|nr:hypothetical protein [Syntrophomonas sp.]
MSTVINQSLMANNEHDGIPEELRNSTVKILNYADISREQGELLRFNLKMYSHIMDNSPLDSDTIKLRDAIGAVFFEVYKSVLNKVLTENNTDRILRMFLLFGYMDEKLLHANHINLLYELVDKPFAPGRFLSFNMHDWLAKIISREEDPSVNEFGQDYFEIFRDKKKRGELNDRDKPGYDNDIQGRLNHEINSILKTGQKLCCGQIGKYFPILNSGLITKDLGNALLTPQKLEASLDKILAVDFSAFHREIVFNQPEKGITKELIMKSVLPNIILMPTFGSRAVMWQELTGKIKTSPGRIIFPIFTDEDLDNLMIDVVAKFRWDLCKNMFSYVRNDGCQSSLAADYAYYIQFYKKNNDLSSEAKHKIKLQMAKCRNNVREAFASDYHTWLAYESKGLVRLNKVAREIFLKYCPFTKSIRSGLEKHPLFNQRIVQFNSLQEKQYKVIKARYSKLNSRNISLDQ